MENLRSAKAFESVGSRSAARVLGAVRFADGTTGRWIGAPLEVTAVGVTLVRNRSGALLIIGATTSPAITIDVRDPSGRYLPRRAQIALPPETQPHRIEADGAALRPLPVPLYPAPAAPLSSGWAVVRVSVKRGATAAGVPYAWVRLRRASPAAAGHPPLAVGMADARGEAMIAVSGLAVTTRNRDGDGRSDGDGDGHAGATAGVDPGSEIDAVLEVYADADVDVSAPPDPDVIDRRRATLPTATQSVRLMAGRQLSVRLALTLP